MCNSLQIRAVIRAANSLTKPGWDGSLSACTKALIMPYDLHPLLVHFPVALTIVICGFEWGRWLLDRERLVNASFWASATPLLFLALLGAIVAVISGLISEKGITESVALHDLVETHQLLAFIAAGGLAVLTFWRISLRGAFPRKQAMVYLLLLLVVTIAVGAAAYYGGLMVYEHGAGVNPQLL